MDYILLHLRSEICIPIYAMSFESLAEKAA